jgi:uncharacterized protein (TIGR00290 family)
VTVTTPVPTVLSWSGGKDSALALHALLMDPGIDLRAILTTITDGYDRVSMHGVRTELVSAQAAAIGLPLWTCRIPQRATNEQYERAMTDSLRVMYRDGIRSIAFGDLFLADVRAYRERLVAGTGLQPIFPLWGKPTAQLSREFVRCGFKAVLVCVDPRQLDVSHCGSEYDARLIAELPSTADPCGENGEFHTFVYDAPMFARPIATQRGMVVEREGFVFCDLLPRDAGGATSL